MSKRGMDIQGGADRYGGQDGSETPMDTPRQATAAQMARRKIATVKRPTRSTSPNKSTPSFGGFGSQQQPAMNSQPPQSGFSFGQNSANGAPAMSNGFTFGQSQPQAQPATNGGFAFGQSQPAANSFTFGQQAPAQSGGFSFNAGSSAVSFPSANGTNPFSSTNGGQTGAGSGFQGSIFNIPGSTNSSQQTQGMTNGFSFGSNNASTTPSSPAQSFNSGDADRKEIEQKEPYLTSEQQKKVEELVGNHLPDSPSSYQKEALDLLPQDIVSQIAQLLRSLPSPGPGSPRNVMSLLVKPYRAKSKKAWVTDAERNELKSSAPGLTPEQQSKLAQIVKDNVEPLRIKNDSDLPSLEYLPNDVQRQMLEFVRKPTEDQSAATPKSANVFGLSNSASQEKSASAFGASTEEQPKANPFASIKSGSNSPAPAPSKPSTPFTFSSPTSASPAQTPLPAFSFSKPTETPPSVPAAKSPESPKQSSEDTPAKPNPFSAVARSVSPSPSPGKAQDSGSQSIFQEPTANETSAGSASTPFKFQSNTTNGTSASATPAKQPSFSFGNLSKTPAPSANNIFNTGSAPTPPATAPAQKTIPSFSQQSSGPPPSKPVFNAASQKQQAPQQQQATLGNKKTAPLPSTYIPSPSDDLVTLVAKTGVLNACFRGFVKTLPTYTDWSAPVTYYLQELQKLKDAVKIKEAEMDAAGMKPTHQTAQPPSTGKPLAPRDVLPASTGKRPSERLSNNSAGQAEDSPAKRQKATPGFQISSPSKPLSNTASLFDNILSSPDKSAAAASPSKSPPKAPVAAPVSSSPFKFQSPTGLNSTHSNTSGSVASPFQFKPAASATPASSAPAPSFQVPKFGNAAAGSQSSGPPKFGGGSSANFLSAFGAQAAKQAEKDKEKQKAEDFDSDEDDEAEWEKQYQEKQAEKKRQLAQTANKVMKNIDGKFVWVDADEAETTPEPVEKPASPTKSGSAAAAPDNPFAHLAQSTTTQQPNGQKALPSAPQQGADEADDDEDETNDVGAQTPAKSGGLFDRIGKNSDGTLEREQQATASKPLFSFSTSTPAADKTWKPETPIKFNSSAETPGSTTPTGSPAKSLFSFGNTAPTPSAGLPKFNFGGSANNESSKPAEAKPFGSLFPINGASVSQPTPNVGFKFGGVPSTPSIFSAPQTGNAAPSLFSSAPASRATTPGATTADETSTAAGTDNEEDAAPPEEQRDLTALSAEEKRTEDVLFEFKARCRKFVKGADNPWDNKGVGILRLLKNKDTGNPRVLMRLSPGGQIVINANLMKNKDLYDVQSGKNVKMVFAEKEGELSTYLVTFGAKESAEDLLGKIKNAA
ncbi:hypothetical protein B9Z65_7667 [Elsinoe australis]|uniref:RanBD1 domain-containing protein n=1 Tax=Elsinoe australis TaxID=40998 RepID=A0A2P8A061_9PEZI|nr:hypothetical protein B9Z65_7667 [Elsinoe australis]